MPVHEPTPVAPDGGERTVSREVGDGQGQAGGGVVPSPPSTAAPAAARAAATGCWLSAATNRTAGSPRQHSFERVVPATLTTRSTVASVATRDLIREVHGFEGQSRVALPSARPRPPRPPARARHLRDAQMRRAVARGSTAFGRAAANSARNKRIARSGEQRVLRRVADLGAPSSGRRRCRRRTRRAHHGRRSPAPARRAIVPSGGPRP